MVEWHVKSKRKPSGGMRRTRRRCDKKLAWRGGTSAKTKIDRDETDAKFGIGNTRKTRTIASKTVNLTTEKGKTIKANIVNVKENNANRLYARANIVTKGASIIVTVNGEEKTARVTNRPGQHGTINAVLE